MENEAEASSSSSSSSSSDEDTDLGKLLDLIKNLRASAKTKKEIDILTDIQNFLQQKIDQKNCGRRFDIDFDSDQEIEENESDSEESSGHDVDERNIISYDMDKILEIINKRDFNKWSIETIHDRFKEVENRKYLSRMRQCLKRGGLINRSDYEHLRESIFDEVYSLIVDGVSLSNGDIQQIGMLQAKGKGYSNFVANNGWLYYFKKQHNLVDRYITETRSTLIEIDEEMHLKAKIEKFKSKTMPQIMSYRRDKIWCADQLSLLFELPPGRTIRFHGTQKVVYDVQRIDTTMHSFTVNIQLNASGCLAPKLSVALHRSRDAPKRLKEDFERFTNLHVYWSKSDSKGSDIASHWMENIFLNFVKEKSVLIINDWNGYKQMLNGPMVSQHDLKVFQLPDGSASVLQPINIYFNRTFKDFIRKFCEKMRWQEIDAFDLGARNNFLNVLDLIWNQCRASKFKDFFFVFVVSSGIFDRMSIIIFSTI